MPIHDWNRVDAGLFHAFHQGWTIHLRDALNGGGLQPEYFALAEQSIGGPIPDVLTLRLAAEGEDSHAPCPGSLSRLLPPEQGISGASKRRLIPAGRTASLFGIGTVKLLR